MEPPAIVIESHDANGAQWGVSYNGHNPEDYQFLPCGTEDQAHKLADAINKPKQCPACGHDDILEPGVDYRRFTCDKCARDFPESFFDGLST